MVYMEKIHPIDWLESNEKYFTVEMNGHDAPPIGRYVSSLTLIDRDGKITDLGCGNGMLLKFFLLYSGRQLVPYGIDRCEAPIKQAQEIILPEYAENFRVLNVKDYHFDDGPFDIILTNPMYVYPRITEFTKECIDNLNKGGRLIYKFTHDSLAEYGYSDAKTLEFINRFGMRLCGGQTWPHAVFDKP